MKLLIKTKNSTYTVALAEDGHHFNVMRVGPGEHPNIPNNVVFTSPGIQIGCDHQVWSHAEQRYLPLFRYWGWTRRSGPDSPGWISTSPIESMEVLL